MTKNEELVKQKIDKILKSPLSDKQIDSIYEIYNTKEMQGFLKWKSTWNSTINDWYNSLDNNIKPLVNSLISIFNVNIQPKKKEKIKMEEIKQQEVVQEQPTIKVVEKEPEIAKKVTRTKKRDKSFYEPIIKEIDELKTSGKKVNEIMNIIKEKYQDVKPGTVMAKYFEWKRNQSKGE